MEPRVDQTQAPDTVIFFFSTGVQGGKLSTAKKIQFSPVPVASFVCELFSVVDS